MTLTASKSFIVIQEGNKSVRVMDSKFDREVGDILTVQGVRFKVVMLHENNSDAAYYLYLYKTHVFSFYDFNAKDGKKF